jgi:hypothetical protein
MQIFNLGVHVRRGRAGLATRKHIAKPIQSLPLPVTDLIGMQSMSRCYLAERLLTPKRLKRYLDLEIVTKSSASTHVVSSSKDHKHTLANCPILQDHLTP